MTGAEQARKLLDPSLPFERNSSIAWNESRPRLGDRVQAAHIGTNDRSFISWLEAFRQGEMRTCKRTGYH